MNKLIYIILPILVGCSGGEDSPNTVDYEEFAGETGIEEEDNANFFSDTTLDLSALDGKLIYAMSDNYDTIENTKFNALDRFSFSSSKKIGFKAKFEVPYGKTAMVYPTAHVFYYSFKDTTSTKNAFYNYLDGLSADGEVGSVKIDQDIDYIKSPPRLVLVYDTVILSAEYMCEHAKNDWRPFEDSILSIYGKDYRHKIEIDCGGPLKWDK